MQGLEYGADGLLDGHHVGMMIVAAIVVGIVPHVCLRLNRRLLYPMLSPYGGGIIGIPWSTTTTTIWCFYCFWRSRRRIRYIIIHPIGGR